jgi:hypothetical protein
MKKDCLYEFGSSQSCLKRDLTFLAPDSDLIINLILG